jgi:hypothetical protein
MSTDSNDSDGPVFNSQKYGTVKKDPTDPTKHIVSEYGSSLSTTAGATIPVRTQAGGRAQGFMPHFIDGSDAMANKGMIVSFQHVPSDENVHFKGFITAFNETYNCDWQSETVFGRADPIHMFKNTQREITLAFNVPAASESEAFENLGRVQRLITFLYPSYVNPGNAITISNSPLVRLKVMNILAARPQFGDPSQSSQNSNSDYAAGTFENLVHDGAGSSWDADGNSSNSGGLLGIIKNVSVNHNLDNPDHGVFEINKGTILPKMIEVNLTFSAIHEHPLGWSSDGDSQKFQNQLFPYGINDSVDAAQTINNSQPNISDLTLANKAARQQLTENLDRLADEVDQIEQDVANAEARYAGAFGKARFNRDKKRLAKGKASPYQESAVRGKITSDITDATNTMYAAIGSESRVTNVDVGRSYEMDDLSQFLDS